MNLPFEFKRKTPSPQALRFLSSVGPSEPMSPLPPGVLPEPPADLGLEMNTRVPLDSNIPLLAPKGGRPKLLPRLRPEDELAGQQQLRTAVGDYEPEKASWKEFLPYIINATLSGGKHGPMGLLGAAGTAIAQKYIQPKMPNEAWKAKQLGETDKRIEGLEKDETRDLQQEDVRSEIALRRLKPRLEREGREQQEKEKRIANLLTMHDRLGHYRPEDINDIGSQQLKAQAQELGIDLVPYEAPEKASAVPPHLTVGDTVFERDKSGNWAPAKGLPKVPPKASEEKPDYETRAAYFIKRQKEKEAEAADLDQQINAIVPAGQDNQGNAVYTDQQKAVVQRLTTQRQQALNDANDFRTKGDEAATMPVAPKTQGTVKPAKDGKWHYTVDQIRASLQPGQTYEEIYAQLKANPKVVIEE